MGNSVRGSFVDTEGRRGKQRSTEKDCQCWEPQISQIRADLGPATAGRTARMIENYKGHKGGWKVG